MPSRLGSRRWLVPAPHSTQRPSASMSARDFTNTRIPPSDLYVNPSLMRAHRRAQAAAAPLSDAPQAGWPGDGRALCLRLTGTEMLSREEPPLCVLLYASSCRVTLTVKHRPIKWVRTGRD